MTLPASPRPFLLVPSTFFPQQLTTFQLRVRASVDVDLNRVDFTDYCTAEVAGEWRGPSAAGYQNLGQNPQFTLTIPQDCRVHIFLQQLSTAKKASAKAGRRAGRSESAGDPAESEAAMSNTKGLSLCVGIDVWMSRVFAWGPSNLSYTSRKKV